MSINSKTKAAVDTLLTDNATTEAEFKTGLQDLTTELDLTQTKISGAVALGNNLLFGVNDKAIFGASSDLQIYNDGSHSYVSDQGTGNLLIRGENILLQKADGLANYLRATPNDAVQIYFNGLEKLATTSTGIDVTGTATMDGLTVAVPGTAIGTAQINKDGDGLNFTSGTALSLANETSVAGSAVSLRFSPGDVATSLRGAFISSELIGANGADLHFYTGTDGVAPVERMTIDGNGDISFYEDTGTTAKFFWDASAESLGIGGTAATLPLGGEQLYIAKASSGTGVSDALRFQMFQGGSTQSQVANLVAGTISGGTPYFAIETRGNSGGNPLERMRINSSGNVGIGTASPASVSGFAKFLEIEDTTSAALNATYDNGAGSTCKAEFGASSAGAWIGTGTSTASAVRFVANGTERMRIDSSGNVGIGTSSPSSKLTVESTSSGSASTGIVVRNSGSTVVGTEAKLYLSTVAGDNRGSYISSVITSTLNTNDLVFGTNSSGSDAVERMRIDSSGNVGIGVTDPAGPFEVADSTRSTYSNYIAPDGNLILRNSGGADMLQLIDGGATSETDANSYMEWSYSSVIGGATTRMGYMGFSSSSNNHFYLQNENDSGQIRLQTNDSVGAGHVSLLVSATDVIVNESGTDCDFRVESDTDTHALFVQGSNGAVGIGTASPSSPLDVVGTNGVEQFRIGNTTGGTDFGITVTENDKVDLNAAEGVTARHMTFSSGGTERMRLDSSGNLLVGKTTTAGATAGHTLFPNGAHYATRDSGTPLWANRLTTDGNIAEFYKDGTTVGSIGSRSGGSLEAYISLNQNGTGAGLVGGGAGQSILPSNKSGAPINNSTDLGNSGFAFKDLYLSGGVYVGGTTSANYLDDYEEGTDSGTPTAVSGTLTTASYNTSYTKIGDVVHVTIEVVITTNGTGASAVRVTLPFAAKSDGREKILNGRRNSGSAGSLSGYIGSGSSVCDIRLYDNTYPGVDGANLVVTGTYQAA